MAVKKANLEDVFIELTESGPGSEERLEIVKEKEADVPGCRQNFPDFLLFHLNGNQDLTRRKQPCR